MSVHIAFTGFIVALMMVAALGIGTWRGLTYGYAAQRGEDDTDIWRFCTTLVDPSVAAKHHEDPNPPHTVVLEQHTESGEYRMRPFTDVVLDD